MTLIRMYDESKLHLYLTTYEMFAENTLRAFPEKTSGAL